MITDRFEARGHEHVRGTHASTLEVTTDDWLTPAGDCIVGIDANQAPIDFDDAFVEAARSDEAQMRLQLDADGVIDSISGRGDPRLTFESERCMIVRTSTYVDDRTVMVDASGAAKDIDRDLIARLRQGATLRVELSVETPDA